MSITTRQRRRDTLFPMNYWLVKSEGGCYSIDDLRKDRKTPWTGVRNFQARNFMRDGMRIGDGVLFYHSNANPSGVYGIARVASAPHSDLTALDRNDEHYDPKSTPDKPIWECVDIAFEAKLHRPVSLEDMKRNARLTKMIILQKGSRLSVTPVTTEEFEEIAKTR